jgi:hypothetical protein
MPATSQEPSGRFASQSEFQAGGSGRRKRVSARHQAKRLDRIFDRACSSENRLGRRKKFSSSVRIQRSAISPGALRQLRFGSDVFADALVPQAGACRRPRFHPQKSQNACLARAGLHPGTIAAMVIALPNGTVN